jgi:HJR/Mrr/RecB family endonuclease
MLQEASLLAADRRGVSIPFTISLEGQKFLEQKELAKDNRVLLSDLMGYSSFVDFINYQVTQRVNERYQQKYEDVGYLAVLNEDAKRHSILHQADEFLKQYDHEINKRLDFFRVYDMKKEDVDLDTLNTLQVVSAIHHCVKLLENESDPQQKNHQSSNIPSMIAAQNKKLRQELLAKIKVITPKQFEELSVLILGHLLYEGQPLSEFKKHLKQQGQSGDGGIDGVVTKYDRIRGTVIHYVQSKRYTTNSVQRPEVQSFVGALDPHRAKIGVFITTSRFTEGAKEYVKSLNLYDVRLVDGFELVEMMIECGIGVKKIADISLIEINNAFFDTEVSLLA